MPESFNCARADFRKASLILDEPFRGLDEMLKEKNYFACQENSDTVLLITHLRSEAEQLRAEILNFENLTQTKNNMT